MDFGLEKRSSSAEETVLTVSQLTRQVRTALESRVGEVTVEGEISNLRKQASGHQYFTLKDAGAQLSCVLFRGNARLLTTPLHEGMCVQARGAISVYEARGQYQMIVKSVRGGGQGALQAKFEALKRRLDEEGLFSQNQKTPLPTVPSVVGIITSPTGAALRDILQVLGRRAPWLRILIYPVRVQGDAAAGEIVNAIATADTDEDTDTGSKSGSKPDAASDSSTPDLPRPDVLIIGRGGGSIEDLWPFNEESVARAIHACSIPVLSAVGHEIDFTISDFVADLRAPTPSAAAELVAPDGADLQTRLTSFQASMQNRAESRVRHWRKILDLVADGTLRQAPHHFLRECSQRTDMAEGELHASVRAQLSSAREAVQKREDRLRNKRPDRSIADRRGRLTLLEQSMRHHLDRKIHALRDRTARADELLRTLGPGGVFARGYSMTVGADGVPVTDAQTLQPGAMLRTLLDQGEVESTVTTVRPAQAPGTDTK